MKLSFVCLCLVLAHALAGQTPLITGHNQKFVHHDEVNGLIMVETLQPGTTLYSLSQRYNVTLDVIMAANPGLEPHSLPMGFPINIPVHVQAITFSPPADSSKRIWLSYRVQPKETLYRISKTYLGVAPEIISTLNPGVQSGLQIGQILHLGWLCVNKAHEVIPVAADSIAVLPKDFIKEARLEGQVIREQKGLAIWKPGNVSSQYFVLHPTAKLGSYVEITNPMLHRTITAKVAGHIPPGLYKSNVGIVVSPSTARALGVLDQQFFASWRYIE